MGARQAAPHRGDRPLDLDLDLDDSNLRVAP
jgi:hypothetical protein